MQNRNIDGDVLNFLTSRMHNAMDNCRAKIILPNLMMDCMEFDLEIMQKHIGTNMVAPEPVEVVEVPKVVETEKPRTEADDLIAKLKGK